VPLIIIEGNDEQIHSGRPGGSAYPYAEGFQREVAFPGHSGQSVLCINSLQVNIIIANYQ
jgi:hypothetical protein